MIDLFLCPSVDMVNKGIHIYLPSKPFHCEAGSGLIFPWLLLCGRLVILLFLVRSTDNKSQSAKQHRLLLFCLLWHAVGTYNAHHFLVDAI